MPTMVVDSAMIQELYTLFHRSSINRKTQALEFWGFNQEAYQEFENKIRLILGWSEWKEYQDLLETTALRRAKFRAKTVKNLETFSDPLAEIAVVNQGQEYTVQQRLTLIKWWLYRKVYSHGGNI